MAADSETPDVREETGPGPFSLHSILVALATVAAATLVVFVVGYHTCGFEGCPDLDQVSGYVPDEASVVVDRDNEEIGKLFRVNRVVIGLDSLPEHVPAAFVATEDREFYEHSGVDLSRVFGAAWQNIRSGGIEEGFSTITMQVARNVFPDQLPANERTLGRKISEVKVARQLEGRYSKEEILELYLNQIYFGSGAWGIQSAAREYFGKDAVDLTLGEAALLAGLPQAPSRLNPRENMEGALERRRTVLTRMEEQGVITAEEARAAGESEPELATSRVETPEQAEYFVEHVRRMVERQLGDVVYTGGYTIHTTLDLDAQRVAERELRQQIEAIESGRYGYFPHTTYAAAVGETDPSGRVVPYLQGAVMVMETRTGDVLAMVGGRDFDDSKFNRAVQARRQPGSAFKPFVYAAALQAGYPPSTVLEDTPYRLAQDGRVWEPRNYDGSYAGRVTMRNALVNSRNVATIRLADRVGLDRVISMARNLGISGDIPHYPSIAIGAAEVTLEDMVAAYSALATLGQRPEPRYVTRVTDRDGITIWQQPARSQTVLDRDVAFLTVDLMRDVVDMGTGAAVRSAGFRAAAAGKTGTTNESADVWFIGFTPEITTGVWIGMDDPQRIMPRATGGRLAAPVWGRIMAGIGAGGGSWSPPPGVESYQVDEFGNIAASNCPIQGEVREEYFLRGTVSAADCYRYGDSLYGDSLYAEDDSWWRRLRERFFGDEEERDRDPSDTIILGPDEGRRAPDPRDTIRLGPPDTMPEPEPDPVTPDPQDPDPDPDPEPLGRDTTLPDPDPVPPPSGNGDADNRSG